MEIILIHSIDTTNAPECGENPVRAKVSRCARLAAAVAVTVPLPLLVSYFLIRWFHVEPIMFGDTASTSLLMLALTAVFMHSMATCSITVVFFGLGCGVGLYFIDAPIVAGVVLVGFALLIGLWAAHKVNRKLLSWHAASVANAQLRAQQEADKLNPRCGTCHARAFCPYQPSGFADRYTRSEGDVAPVDTKLVP